MKNDRVSFIICGKKKIFCIVWLRDIVIFHSGLMALCVFL
jgi:hypothetical protein